MKSKATGIQFNDHTDDGQVFDLKINPVRDASGKILSGIVIGQTIEQNIATMLVMYPGDMKAEPRLGVGLRDALLDEDKDLLEYRHRINENFEQDGLKINSLDLYDINKFNIDAEYK